jgi:myo-inositol-1(or 4)-monophosphatase
MHPMLNTAVKAARRAAAIINRASFDIERVKVSQKSHNDFVTEVDRASEQAIIEVLKTAYPDHAILAEESGASNGHEHAENLWIIDPLDGTTNFIHGFPQYCISIALQQRGQITQAVVYDPNRNDLFTATKGAGAFLNEKRIRVSRRDKMSDSLIGTGFPFRSSDNLDEYVKMFRAITEKSAGLRRPGAAALDLAYVAAGRLDGFFEKGLAPWDVAAGSLLVMEAGGIVGDFAGESDYLFKGNVLAGSPKIFAQMVNLLASFK